MADLIGHVLRPQLRGQWLLWARRAQAHQQYPGRNQTTVAVRDDLSNTDVLDSTATSESLQQPSSTRSVAKSKSKPSQSTLQEFLRTQYKLPSPPASVTKEDEYGIIYAARTGDVNQLMYALENASQDKQYIASIPNTTWTALFGAIGRQRGLLPIHKRQNSLGTKELEQAGYYFSRDRQNLLGLLFQCVGIRQEAGSSMMLADYSMLLRIASSLGDPETARRVWRNLKNDQVVPNAACYDYMINAIVFDEDARSSAVVRESSSAANSHMELHDIKRWDKMELGVFEEVHALYTEMRSSQIKPDVSTDCAMMICLSRFGRLQSALSILGQRWQVSLPAIFDGSLALEDRGEELPESSVPAPTTKVLSTIAQILGSANQITAAIRLIDYFHDRYQMKMSTNTWSILLQWTYLHGRAEARRQRYQGLEYQPTDDLPQLLEVMLSAPYHVKPTLEMTHMLFKTNRSRRLLGTGESMGPVMVAQATYAHWIGASRDARQHMEQDEEWQPGTVRQPFRLQRRLRSTLLQKRLNQGYLTRWVRAIIGYQVTDPQNMPREEQHNVDDWHVRGLPNFILRWKVFLPNWIKYQAASGHVELLVRTREETRQQLARKGTNDQRKDFKWYDTTDEPEPWDRDQVQPRTLSGQGGPGQHVSNRTRKLGNQELGQLLKG
ncbi:MAG: hypothetical protein M1828_005437 [Chrysothrix sp. TS-e1954]|nr:MAG: hypothetical protein M1828_005437 [Chrysothrix sp. TS-e1954]